jgi:hypothetical protein
MNTKLLDEFSQWITDNDWNKNYTNSLWYHSRKINKDYKLSVVFKKFLKNK